MSKLNLKKKVEEEKNTPLKADLHLICMRACGIFYLQLTSISSCVFS